jgi:hypothetical protein
MRGVLLDKLLRPGSLPRLEKLTLSGLLTSASLFPQKLLTFAFFFTLREMN